MVHFVLTCICYGMLGVCISLERKSWLKLQTGWYRSDLVSYSIPRNTAGPDHSSIAEVHSLGSSKHTGQTEATLVLSSRVPAEVRNHWERDKRYFMILQTGQHPPFHYPPSYIHVLIWPCPNPDICQNLLCTLIIIFPWDKIYRWILDIQ